MADETAVSADPTPDAAPAAPVDAQPAPAPDPLAEFRERLARLEGENAALRAQVTRPAETATQPATPAWTPASIRQAYDAGQITDDQRVMLLAKIGDDERLAQYDAQRRRDEAERRADTDLQPYLRAYPTLNDPGSQVRRDVDAEIAAMARDEGANPRSVVVQLRAVKSVLGRLDAPPSTARRGIPIGPTGSPQGGAPSPGGGKTDPLKGIPPDIIDDWRRLGAKLTDPAEVARYADRYNSMLARRQRRTTGVA